MAVVEGYHPLPTRADMEIIERLLKTHFGVGTRIEAKQSHPYQEILFKITKALNAKTVVELGTDIGVSCSAFVKALKEPGGHLYSIDLQPNPMSRLRVRETMQRHVNDPVTFIHGDAVEVGVTWDGGPIDVLYCDDGHQYQQVLDQLRAWGRFNPKIILIHDTLVRGNEINHPYRAAKEYTEKHKKIFINLKFGEGLGIIV